MQQIERLIARLVQLVEDSPGQTVMITVVTDDKGLPVYWYASKTTVEGMKEVSEIHSQGTCINQ